MHAIIMMIIVFDAFVADDDYDICFLRNRVLILSYVVAAVVVVVVAMVCLYVCCSVVVVLTIHLTNTK